MADIIAAPIPTPTPSLPEGMLLHPWLDQPAPLVGALGIPLWFLISCGVVFLIIMVNSYWKLRMNKLAPVRGYRDTLRKASQEDVQTWVFGKTKKLTIEMLRYVDSILSYYTPTNTSKWHLNTPMSVIHMGGLPGLVVSDDYDQARDIVSEIALCHAADKFNAHYEQVNRVKKAIDKGTLEELKTRMDPDEVDRIHAAILKWGAETTKDLCPIESYADYETCGRKILKLLYPDGIPIPSYSIFNPTRFRKYFPKGRSAGLRGGILDREAEDLKPPAKEQGFWDKYLPYGIVMAIGIVMLIASWVAPLGR